MAQFQVSADKLMAAFIDSVHKVLDEANKMSAKVDAIDPDPERTKSHHLNNIFKKWFMTGGGLGY